MATFTAARNKINRGNPTHEDVVDVLKAAMSTIDDLLKGSERQQGEINQLRADLDRLRTTGPW
jgi:hypothetical protein